MSSEQPVALVAGGSRRLGRHLVEDLARQGFAVAINYLRSEAEARALAQGVSDGGGQAWAMQADVSDPEQVADLIGRVREDAGRLDLLVFNVGLYEPGPVQDLSAQAWDRCLATNLSGAFYCAQAAHPLLAERGGQFVAIGYAGLDLLTGNPDATAYQVSKTGLLVLIKSLAEAWAPAVRANMISPGQLVNSIDLPDDPEASIPLGRAGRLDEVSHALRYLLEASYVTGVNVDVAGGYRLGGSLS